MPARWRARGWEPRCDDEERDDVPAKVRAAAAEEVAKMGVEECVQAVLALSAEDIASVQAKLWAALIGGRR